MPSKEEMLNEIRREASHRNLSARALSRLTGMHKQTVGDALKGRETTRQSTVLLLYTALILQRDSRATAVQEAKSA